jgi:hypothetical protein
MLSAEKEVLGTHGGHGGAMMFGMGETMRGDASRQLKPIARVPI